ncbi:hypothetical protein [Bradyrhizobium sp. JYMT SZCCT0428]|uniref:hypothetical protein n=1 Tax=Bradyrhizobium sp. JYMT SZCCT0428 TaxID=2807673 RepID=UPI001BA681BD|nr:hypothetical protein [Bradyrhizobium sp. JYMT SZCCT0428]MBR1156585.1 hypothetical protein [Bradyrhizobium sp. JYMT SZCCT0428]
MNTTGRHTEIARRYGDKRKREPFSIAAKRVSELTRLFAARYRGALPDDDAGRDDAFVMVHHLACRPDAERRIPLWLGLHAPWMAVGEIRDLTATAIAKPFRWKADKLAKRLNLIEADRQRLGITTIGAVDVDKAARLTRRKERARLRREHQRRSAGAQKRIDYEANSLSRTKPWEAMGISRRTWYRRHTNPGGTSACAA